MKQILVAGSLAYDTIDKVVFFGGCAGNIAYNARLLNKKFVMLGIVGKDFDDYEKWLQKNNIDTEYVVRCQDDLTARAMITTDAEGHQVALFSPGAADLARHHQDKIQITLKTLAPHLSFALISPNSHGFMNAVIEGCISNNVPFFFDPGQALPLFSSQELMTILPAADGLFLNEDELLECLALLTISQEELRRIVPLLIVTYGEKGSRIFWCNENGDDEIIEIPAVTTPFARDPTGCGDAYRAGFLATIQEHFPTLTTAALKNAGCVGATLATACVQSYGTQNHLYG